MKTNTFFRGVIFGLVGFALIIGAGLDSASAQEKQTRIITIKDPQSGDDLNVELTRSSRARFDQDKPSALFRERDRMRQEMLRNCAAGKVGIFRSVQKQFVPESVGFAAAIAVVGQVQANGDPGALKHWWEQSVTDPLAQVSFGMFMVGNRAAGEFMNHVGWTFDPCTAVKKVRPGAPLEFGETRLQKTFRPLAGGMAMSVGLIASSVTHELLADPNLRMCANIMLGRVPQDKMAEAEKACDIAHEEWAPGNKMADYLDDVLANVVFVCFQGYGVEAAKVLMSKGADGAKSIAERNLAKRLMIRQGAKAIATGTNEVVMKFAVTRGVKTIAFMGAEAVLSVGKFAGPPVVRGAIWLGNMVWFLVGIDWIMPFFENPWTKFRDGREVTGAINEIMLDLNKIEKNGWVWAPPAKPYRCSPEYQRAMRYSKNEFAQVVPPECFTTPKTPGDLIDRLNYKQKKWREFVMRDAYAETANWQDFVLQFTNTYSAAYKLYSNIVQQVQEEKFMVERGVPNSSAPYIYMTIPMFGLPIDYANWDGSICHLPQDTKTKIAQARAVVDAELARPAWKNLPNLLLRPDTAIGLPNVNPNFGWKDWSLFNSPVHSKEPEAFKRNMETIRAGLVAADCRLPMPVVPEFKSVRDVNPQQLEDLRKKRFAAAINTLFIVLTREPPSGYARWTDGGRDIDHDLYPFFSKINPYMKINSILMDPEPYGPGVFFVRTIDNEETFIDQSRKADHPRKVGGIATPKMSEYLLVQMVCGPEATRGDQVRIESTWQRGKSILARNVSRSWGFNDDFTTATNERMVDIVRGWKSEFIPPRIINDPGFDICRTKPSKGDWQMDAGKMPTNDYQWDPHMNSWTIRGVSHRGFLTIVKHNLRKDVLGTDMNDGSFQRWWIKNVEPVVKPVVADFQRQYRKIIGEKYLPALVKNERTTYNGRSFALGARNSMMDEFKLNLAILKRIHNAGRTQGEPGFDSIRGELGAISITFDRMAKLVGTPTELKSTLVSLNVIDPKKSVTWSSPESMQAYAQNQQAIMGLIDGLDKKMGSSVSKKLGPAAVTTVEGVRKAAVTNLKNLVTELDSYNGMLLTLRLEDVSAGVN